MATASEYAACTRVEKIVLWEYGTHGIPLGVIAKEYDIPGWRLHRIKDELRAKGLLQDTLPLWGEE